MSLRKKNAIPKNKGEQTPHHFSNFIKMHRGRLCGSYVSVLPLTKVV